jgi:hypothetical protein
MSVVFEGLFDPGTAIHIPVSLTLPGKEALFCAGIIDTGSPQSIVNWGVLDDEWFASEIPKIGIRDTNGNETIVRGSNLCVLLSQGASETQITIPIYENRIGAALRGTPVMLVGRSLLKHGRFILDGVNARWQLAFECE